MSTEVFKVPAENLEALQMEVARLNKKAKKLGTDPLALEVLGYDAKPLPGGFVRVFYNIKLEGPTPKIGGYTFVAKIDHNNDASGESNLIYGMPGAKFPDEIRNAPAKCDHCGYGRKRRLTYIIQKDDTGELKQIGHTCIRDFIGHDPSVILKMAQGFLTIVEDAKKAAEGTGEGKGMYDHRNMSFECFAGYVAYEIRTAGWVSGKTAYERGIRSTRDCAWEIMVAEDEDQKNGINAVAWLAQQDPSKDNFWHNLVTLAKQGWLDFRSAAFAAAGVMLFLKEQEKAKAAPQNTQANSQHIGQVGERFEIDVTVLGKKVVEGYYGLSTMVRMQDNLGNVLFTFATGAFSPNVGETIKIRGTVKAHNEYKGVKQTQLTRVTAL